MTQNKNIIKPEWMGDIWPSVMPSANVEDLGSATISSTGPFIVRSFHEITITYTIGKYGLDDTGGIIIAQRFMNDTGPWQTNDPQDMNYVTATASNGVPLDIITASSANPSLYLRPWGRIVRILVCKGSMQEGDTITIVFGDKSQGGKGMRMPTFCELGHEFRVLVDACATGHHYPIIDRTAIDIVPNVAHTWRAIIPSLRHVGRSFKLAIRGDDIWGNPSDKIQQKLFLSATGPVENVPESVEFNASVRCLHIPDLKTTGEGIIHITIKDEYDNILVTSNPLVVKQGEFESFWGDLHGQSGETVGINTIDAYFDFGKNLGVLDIMCHQANDFQVTDVFWEKINDVARTLNKDDEFIVFPGYEWSGNTPMGGDHNVIYFEEGNPIYRSSRSLIHDKTHPETDTRTTTQLFANLAKENCISFGHVGGRPVNIAQADGGNIRTAVEIHSDWGTFEWIMADNFELGYRHGVVANSDGHKGRPGASHPGASSFGALGGLTCVLSPTLTRTDIFEAYRRRHHYATTGVRMTMDVKTEFPFPVKIFNRNPNYGETSYEMNSIAMMGDIVQTTNNTAEVTATVHTQSPIISCDFLSTMDTVTTHRPYTIDDLGNRVRVTFHGAEYRGRGRQTTWIGSVKINNTKILDIKTLNKWNNEFRLEQMSDNEIMLHFITTGNFLGFDVWLDDVQNAEVVVDTQLANGTVGINDLGMNPYIIQAGGLDRRVNIMRLPDTLSICEMSAQAQVPIADKGDTPLWVRITTEDGHIAWSSPTYIFK